MLCIDFSLTFDFCRRFLGCRVPHAASRCPSRRGTWSRLTFGLHIGSLSWTGSCSESTKRNFKRFGVFIQLILFSFTSVFSSTFLFLQLHVCYGLWSPRPRPRLQCPHTPVPSPHPNRAATRAVHHITCLVRL